MISIEQKISSAVGKAATELWNTSLNPAEVQIQKTRKEFTGDLTVVVFPLTRLSRTGPEQTGKALGDYLQKELPEIIDYNVIKGFLNLTVGEVFWSEVIRHLRTDSTLGLSSPGECSEMIMVEYSSPNTNKPLHLGHIRNNLLGFSVSRILEANGKKVVKVNLVNDRGIHICKSMLAWKKWGNGETPQSSGMKGDHLVGKYYVLFEQELKKQLAELKQNGGGEEERAARTPIMQEAQEMLRKWESGDPETIALWKQMNEWVYEGFDKTYRDLGVTFDKIYYESETYLLGKAIVLEALKKGILYRKEDNSVWADLTDRGLDHKVLLRSDGTSVYMTQDIGTAVQRFNEYPISQLIYVVGNEQNYHFQALSIILDKLGYSWAKNLHHLSYGMVELPEGKMKSREGTVVDADDLIAEMIETARQMSSELGKLDGYSPEEAERIYRTIGLGALKYFILKVDPKKNMMFDPRESIDFNGNTGPFIQYTYARIRSVMNKAAEQKIAVNEEALARWNMSPKERMLARLIYEFPSVVENAADTYSPAVIANYVYELAKEYNQFYHDYSILKAESPELVSSRLLLSEVIGRVIEKGMYLLGIDVPERM